MALTKMQLEFFDFLALRPQKVGDPCYIVSMLIIKYYYYLFIGSEKNKW